MLPRLSRKLVLEVSLDQGRAVAGDIRLMSAGTGIRHEARDTELVPLRHLKGPHRRKKTSRSWFIFFAKLKGFYQQN
jgi:hypothetical protein